MTPEVTLLAHTPDPVRVMALSARLCYTQGQTIAALKDKLTPSECEKLVRKIISNRHHGVLEHVSFTFGVEGVSRDCSHQIVRHRNTSYDQQSLHYTLAQEGFDMAMPAKMSAAECEAWEEARLKSWQVYEMLVKSGKPREDARHILPGGIETRLIMTANLRQWMKFVEVRACVVNCHEITVVAHKVANELVKVMPFMTEYLGPTCQTEKVCHEGNKFCGAPWAFPCTIRGNGNNKKVYDLAEAKAWTPKS